MSASRHLIWPADRFYWCVIDASVLPRRHRRSAEQCGYLFEADLPIALELVHVVFTPLEDGRVLGCAIEREVLKREVNAASRTLVPDKVPAAVLANGDTHAGRLNCLTGSFLPATVHRTNRMIMLSAVFLIVTLAIVANVGFWRRANEMQSERLIADARVHSVFCEALGRDIVDGPGSLAAAELELEVRVEQLRRTRDQDTAGREVFDAAAMLSLILDAWPEEPVQVHTVIIARDAVVIRGRVKDPLIPPRITAALSSLPAWRTRLVDSSQKMDDTWEAEWRLERIEQQNRAGRSDA